MRLKITTTIVIILCSLTAFSQHWISGVVTNSAGKPVEGANVFIMGTIEGASTDKDGKFKFSTAQQEMITLGVSYIGYKDYKLTAKVADMANLSIVLSAQDKSLNEVVIRASSFSLGKTRTLEKMDALDVVMTGSSNGDIYGALQSLPGTQKVGEDGKLYIRGGENRETQTFIDGMHVLMPYTSTAQNMPSRGRFSPFLFDGINFSLGGYESEYGQALSAVLPMDTKEVASGTKLGVNVSPLSIGGGGTVAFKKSSLSANLIYTDLTLYNKVFPDAYTWKRPYQSLSAEAQYRAAFGTTGIFKLYTGYDRTFFIRTFADTLNHVPQRDFNLNQDNYYINATVKSQTKKKYHLFLGAAFSYVNNRYANANFQNDEYRQSENEWHIKAKVDKSVSRIYKISAGMETYLKGYQSRYQDTLSRRLQDQHLNYQLYAAYLDNQFRIVHGLYGNVSGRLEYAGFNQAWNVSPRFSLNYIADKFQVSAIYGKYYQTPDNTVLVANHSDLKQELATHYILGASYDFKGKLVKAEFYYKDYDHLHLLRENVYNSAGYGSSSGFDLYLSDETSIKNLKYNVSYSYNDSKRLYNNFLVASTPLFATKHNARMSVRYLFSSLNTYVGISNTFASGRPYINPNINSDVNSTDKYYYSLDVNMTFLLSKKVILYTSASNITGRNNTYGYTYAAQPDKDGIYRGTPVTASRNTFFYIGLFISLKNNSAYDVSNF
ncbi:TonB-dependent receptor [Chitinophaga vietnamensis]|uniref:TonB-dependent receptor n=1 Tax=Chitinophaga vietnamensis TaxID=2593957 RepID=UPI0011783E21|nr:TonB-dependent receptor [Chitinophaga vietnamensis]